MLRKIKQAQNEDNDSHVVIDCDAIELDVFTCGGAKQGKRGWGAAGKVKVAAAAVKRYIWDDEQENMDVFEATEGVRFRIVSRVRTRLNCHAFWKKRSSATVLYIAIRVQSIWLWTLLKN